MLCLKDTKNKKIKKPKRTRIGERGGHNPFVTVLSLVPLFTQHVAVCTVGCCTVLLTTDKGCVATKQLIKKWCLFRLAIVAKTGSVMLVVLLAGQRQTLRTCTGALWVNLWVAAVWYILLWELII
jgi:hypothetical protein